MKDENIAAQAEENASLDDEQLDGVAGGGGWRSDPHRRKRHYRLKKLAEQNREPEEQGILWDRGDNWSNDPDADIDID